MKKLLDKAHSKAPLVYETTLFILLLSPPILLLIYLITNASWR